MVTSPFQNEYCVITSLNKIQFQVKYILFISHTTNVFTHM